MLKNQMHANDVEIRALSDNELDAVNGGVAWVVAVIAVAMINNALIGAAVFGRK